MFQAESIIPTKSYHLPRRLSICCLRESQVPSGPFSPFSPTGPIGPTAPRFPGGPCGQRWLHDGELLVLLGLFNKAEQNS